MDSYTRSMLVYDCTLKVACDAAAGHAQGETTNLKPFRKALVGTDDFDLKLLSAFVAVVEAGSVTNAAAQLHRTQSGVSMQLKRLEERLGQRLMERNAHGVSLTEHGQRFFDYARQIIELSREARSIFETSSVTGTIRLGVTEWFADKELQWLLSRFALAHPNIDLTMRVSTSARLRTSLGNQELDLVLAVAPPGHGAGNRIVHREPLVWVAGRQSRLQPRNKLSLALFEPPCPYRELAADGLRAAGWRWRENFTGCSVESVRGALETGFCETSIFPRRAVDDNLRILSGADGFPELPATELVFYDGMLPQPAATAQLRDYLADCLQHTT